MKSDNIKAVDVIVELRDKVEQLEAKIKRPNKRKNCKNCPQQPNCYAISEGNMLRLENGRLEAENKRVQKGREELRRAWIEEQKISRQLRTENKKLYEEIVHLKEVK